MEFPRVYPPLGPAVLHRIPQMQHFVKHYIFQSDSRHCGTVEDPADDYGIVRRIEMAQPVARDPTAPAQLRPAQQVLEVFRVQRLEDRLQVIMTTLRAGDELAAPDLADQMHLPAHVPPVQVEPVAVGVNWRGRAAK